MLDRRLRDTGTCNEESLSLSRSRSQQVEEEKQARVLQGNGGVPGNVARALSVRLWGTPHSSPRGHRLIDLSLCGLNKRDALSGLAPHS